MKQTLLAVTILFLYSNSIHSQGKPEKNVLSGKVTDAKTGTPLPGASIFIHDLKIGAIAHDDGSFKTSSIAPGKYLIEVSSVGFETIIESIDIEGNTEMNFAMQPAAREQEGVTVTGVSAPTRLRQSPQPVAIVKRDDLVKISSTNIINSLVHIPGVNTLTTGPAISKPFIRGLGYNRVVTINDGVRQEGQQWGDEHGIEIDDYSAQRVEVLKGPASLMYGSDALAGVINIQSLLPAPEGLIKANVLSEYQTNNHLRGFFGNVAGTKNGFSFNAYGSYKGAADYKNKYDGYVFNSKFYNKDFGGMLGYGGSWGHSYLNITSFDQHIGMVEGKRDSATGLFLKALPGGNEAIAKNEDFKKIDPEVPFQHIQHFKITSDNSFNISRSKLDLTLGFQHNQRREFGNPDNTSAPDAYFDLKTFNYALKFNLPYRNYWRTSMGITGMSQTNKNKAEETLIPDYSLLDAGIFVFTQYQREKLTISGGLRFDNRHVDSRQMMDGTAIKFAAFTKNFANISGSAGISYQATKELTLKFNLARGFRAPSLAELASNGAHEGTNRYEIGDNNLKSETSLQIDGGFEINTEHVTLGTSVYYNHINNFIFYERIRNSTGGDSIVTDPNTGNKLNLFRFSGQNTNLYGFEFNMDIHPHPLDWLHFENTISYTRAQFSTEIDGTKNVPFIPAARYISELKGNFLPKGKKLRNLYISLESDYTFRQNHPFTGYNTETATGDYWVVNASVGTGIVNKKGKTVFTIHLSGMNLGDVAYQNHLSRLKYTDVNNVTGRIGVFNTGKNFGVKVNVPLDFKWD
ncbi:MAG: TonB-dependent receptor [Bacteroidetes bacterium]|nr:TonB-dependent receptor [Bacteroidota bacterium]